MAMWLILLFCAAVPVLSLENGLARTPPMGWMSWAAFRCETDCNAHPTACINDQLYQTMGDRLGVDSWRAVGYNRIHVDDCWLSMTRDSKGKLTANSTRFPNGISGLTKYMHDRNLLFGIYEDTGKKTCAGYPGNEGHEKVDAQTFADWECDYLKYDGCNRLMTEGHIGYPTMERALNATGRPILFSCEWPNYEKIKPLINYTEIAQSCNLWRNYNDVENSWTSIHSIMEYFNSFQDEFIAVNGPGQWNDPDMLVAGNLGVSFNAGKTQMTVWSIWSAPLILSADLRTLTPDVKTMLQNPDVIAVNQDPMGKMGRMIMKAANNNLWIYTKPMLPITGSETSYAIAVVNINRNSGNALTIQMSKLGLNHTSGYHVKDLWSGADMGTLFPADSLKIPTIPTTGAAMYKATLNP